MPDVKLVKSIISKVHPEYERKEAAWERNERRFQAGDDVYDELTKFRWEDSTRRIEDERDASKVTAADTRGYAQRKSRAVFPELPATAAEKFVGTIFSKEPAIDYGSLGQVRDDPTGTPTKAEIIFENADGTGHDARTFMTFWSDALQHAMATKFRWVLVEAPRQKPNTQADELAGLRPYFVEYSPLDVPNWLFERGTLQFARIELEERKLQVEDGELVDEMTTTHYLMVRKGFTGFGEEFARGGWWMFDKEGDPILDGEQELTGDWSATGGEIPLFRLYYERGTTRSDNRTGITHLGNIAVSYMDVLSWMWHDAQVSGMRKRYFLGADPDQWSEIQKHELEGGVDVPVPPKVSDTGEVGGNVSIFDTGSISAHGALETLLEKYMELATQTIMRELTTAPDASGESRRVEFLQGNSPRLAHMAANLEEAMNIGLHFLEMRWGSQPTGSVTWQKQFDLKTVLQKVREFFELLRLSGAKSPTLESRLLMEAARSEGQITEGGDFDLDSVQNELQTSLEVGAQGNQTGSAVDILRRRINGNRQTEGA